MSEAIIDMGELRDPGRLVLFLLRGHPPFLEVPRVVALDFLQWLGFGRPEYGAFEVSIVLALCSRRLWQWRSPQSDEAGLGHPPRVLRKMSAALAAKTIRASVPPSALLHFG